MTRPLACILVLIIGLLLSACRNTTDNEKSKNNVYYRIQASYEYVETEEIIDFDFVVSCYNRDVPGSFQGVAKPRVIFKALQDGSAISLVPQEHYCERAVRGYPLQKDNDKFKMPLLIWYPDINDLGFGYTYMSNDAYQNNTGKINLISFSIALSDRNSFDSWLKEAEEDYRQIGAIPGAFGCGGGETPNRGPYYCGHKSNILRNSSYSIFTATSGAYLPHARVINLSKNDVSFIREYYGVEHRYLCEKGITLEANKKYDLSNIWNPYVDVKLGYEDRMKSFRHDIKLASNRTYLDPSNLLDEFYEKSEITEIYPLAYTSAGTDILVDPDWRGFNLTITPAYEYPPPKEIAGKKYDYSVQSARSVKEKLPLLSEINYSGNATHVLAINGQAVCESVKSERLYGVFDLENKQYIKTR